MSVRDYLLHIRECRLLRRLLREYDSENLRNLYWYDLPLHEAVRWRGIFHVLLWAVFKRGRDEIAGNYDIVNLYSAPTQEDDAHVSCPTVWHCRSLKSKPWIDEDSAAKRLLEQNAQEIKSEYQKAREFLRTHPDNESLVDRGQWRGLFLYQASGEKNEDVCSLCPTTTRVVESLPICRNFGFVQFSVLEPHTHIQAHCGSSNLRLRHHLGVEIPEQGNVTLRVGTKARSWQQDKCSMFDDSFRHESTHNGDKTRVVLIVDLWHPGLTDADIEFLSHPVFQSFGKGKRH